MLVVLGLCDPPNQNETANLDLIGVDQIWVKVIVFEEAEVVVVLGCSAGI